MLIENGNHNTIGHKIKPHNMNGFLVCSRLVNLPQVWRLMLIAFPWTENEYIYTYI